MEYSICNLVGWLENKKKIIIICLNSNLPFNVFSKCILQSVSFDSLINIAKIQFVKSEHIWLSNYHFVAWVFVEHSESSESIKEQRCCAYLCKFLYSMGQYYVFSLK
jgi:hypothetical protein